MDLQRLPHQSLPLLRHLPILRFASSLRHTNGTIPRTKSPTRSTPWTRSLGSTTTGIAFRPPTTHRRSPRPRSSAPKLWGHISDMTLRQLLRAIFAKARAARRPVPSHLSLRRAQRAPSPSTAHGVARRCRGSRREHGGLRAPSTRCSRRARDPAEKLQPGATGSTSPVAGRARRCDRGAAAAPRAALSGSDSRALPTLCRRADSRCRDASAGLLTWLNSSCIEG